MDDFHLVDVGHSVHKLVKQGFLHVMMKAATGVQKAGQTGRNMRHNEI